MELKIKDKYELLALHRVFMEAKFNHAPQDLLVQGSPFVKELYERILVLLEEEDGRNPPGTVTGNSQRWSDWRTLENHSHRTENLKNRLGLISSSDWNSMGQSDKVKYIQCLVVPLVATEGEINDLIVYADGIHENN